MNPRLQETIERDGDHCVWCCNQPWKQDLTLEHVLPRSRGGRTEARNFMVACRKCNNVRKSQAVGAYLRDLQQQGVQSDLNLIEQALERLSASDHKDQRTYALKQIKQVQGLRLTQQHLQRMFTT